METGPGLKVSSDRLVKSAIEPATPGLQGERFIHYTTMGPYQDTTHLCSIGQTKKQREQICNKYLYCHLISRITIYHTK